MKSFSLLAAVSTLSTQVAGHYIFQQFTYGGTLNPVGKYIRPNTNYNSPIIDLTSPDLRCNEGGALGATTETITVQAGQSFSFTADQAVYHAGPIAIYMAKAPSTAATFDGSGPVWFKIWEQGPVFSGSTVTWPLAQTYTATFPSALPNGDYLVRIEQLGLHNPYPAGIPQFYLECAQVTVTNGGNGVPGPLVNIPGHVLGTELSYTVNIYNNFLSYSMLGPAVWTGGSVGGGATSTAGPATTTVRTSATTTTTTTTTVRTTTPAVSSTTTTTTTPVVTTTTTSAAGSSTGAPIAKYGQCGGQGWTGGSNCSGSVCTFVNDFYSQCL